MFTCSLILGLLNTDPSEIFIIDKALEGSAATANV